MNTVTDRLYTRGSHESLNPTRSAVLTLPSVEIERSDEVLTPAALALLETLHRKFNARRLALLEARRLRQREIDSGVLPNFLPCTNGVRQANWRIAAVPEDLRDRRVEITGPVDRKMIINALNAPVQAFMADFEDSSSPTWANMINGQINLRDATSRSISYTDARNKRYVLNDQTATLIVRPRGWHLPEKHVLIDGEPVSASLFDFAIYLANNHESLARTGSGPYFYLPKLESHLEARLWNDVFLAAQNELGLPRGTIKATVLIETILAAFEMDEILFELREHIAGLNCGRWDYIFSFIKKFRHHPAYVLPDRGAVTMDRHFLKSYVDLLIHICHRRGAHAMGGMAAQIPIRDNPVANDAAMAKVRADKMRELLAGHDGTWIAHPGLAPIAQSVFDAIDGPNQLCVKRGDIRVTARDLLFVPPGAITENGIRHNIRVGVQYLAAWLGGSGCVPLYSMMEDAATAEICRAQLWQWLHHHARTDDNRVLTVERLHALMDTELNALRDTLGAEIYDRGGHATAATLFAAMITKSDFDEFLTLPAYELLA